MKVLFVTNIPVPYRIDFYNELGKSVDVTVIFEAKGAADQGIRFNYNIDEIKNFKAIFLSDGDIREKRIDFSIFEHIGKQYDKIILTNYSYFTEMALLIYLKLKGIAYYLSSDGGIIKYDESRLKKLFKTFLISGAKGYFSPSKKSDEYLEYYGAKQENIYRYPFTSFKKNLQLDKPVSMERKAELKKLLGISERYLILGIGQFIHRKGWDILLKAMSNVKPNAALCLIGGSENDEYRDIVHENRLNNIYFKDFMKSDELNLYYSAADVFVLPTREDIWGLVINEAMNFGLPVITTKQCIAGLELVQPGKNGYIVDDIEDEAAPSELAAYINLILSDEDRMKTFSRESIEIIKNYSIEAMAESYKTVVMEMRT